MTNILDAQLQEASKAIDFKSEILEAAPTMSYIDKQKALDELISKSINTKLNIEIRERSKKEATVLALMNLRNRR